MGLPSSSSSPARPSSRPRTLTMSRVQATARVLVRTARPTWAPQRLSSTLSAFESGLEGNSPPASLHLPSHSLAPRGGASAAGPATPSLAAFNAPPPRPTDPLAVQPDQELLSVLARLIMRDGKLARAHAFLDTMLQELQLATSSPPLPVLERAIELASPSIRMVGRRKGTKVMQTPQPLTGKQRRRQAWKWIVDASDKRQGTEKDFGRRLAQECLAVLNGQSEALKKVTGTHTLGVTGRAKCVPLLPCLSRARRRSASRTSRLTLPPLPPPALLPPAASDGSRVERNTSSSIASLSSSCSRERALVLHRRRVDGGARAHLSLVSWRHSAAQGGAPAESVCCACCRLVACEREPACREQRARVSELQRRERRAGPAVSRFAFLGASFVRVSASSTQVRAWHSCRE